MAQPARRRFDPASIDKGPRGIQKVDVLVNNAGIAGMNKPTVDYLIEEWERVLRINLTSQFLCCRAVAPLMVKGGLRPHRQHRFDRRQGRQPERRGVLGFQGRRDCVDQEPGQGAGTERRPGELRHPGGRQDHDLRADDRAAHRLHAVEDPDEPASSPWTRSRRSSAGSRARIAVFLPAGFSTSLGGRATY